MDVPDRTWCSPLYSSTGIVMRPVTPFQVYLLTLLKKREGKGKGKDVRGPTVQNPRVGRPFICQLLYWYLTEVVFLAPSNPLDLHSSLLFFSFLQVPPFVKRRDDCHS